MKAKKCKGIYIPLDLGFESSIHIKFRFTLAPEYFSVSLGKLTNIHSLIPLKLGGQLSHGTMNTVPIFSSSFSLLPVIYRFLRYETKVKKISMSLTCSC